MNSLSERPMSVPENDATGRDFEKWTVFYPLKRKVTHTRKRDHQREYIVQVNEDLVEELFSTADFKETGLLVVRNPNVTMKPEIHVRYKKVEERGDQADNNSAESEEDGITAILEDDESLSEKYFSHGRIRLNNAITRSKFVEFGSKLLFGQAGEVEQVDRKEKGLSSSKRERPTIGSGEIGLDFTLRYGLAVPAEVDTNYGDAVYAGFVELEPAENVESMVSRRVLNDIIGVRPQLCRVRMGVLPDLEDKVCRIPENTMQIIGIEEGDYVCIESSEDIIRGVKAFTIDEDTEEMKEIQKEEQSERYVDCWERLGLNHLRQAKVDIPEIYIDAETRYDLKLEGRGENGGTGVCQPVRVYRDPVGVLTKSAHTIAIPFAILLVARGIGADGNRQFYLFSMAVLLMLVGLLIRHRSMLGKYGFGKLLDQYHRLRNH